MKAPWIVAIQAAQAAPFRRMLTLCGVLVALASCPPHSVHADSQSWTGTTSGAWLTTSNWGGTPIPGSTSVTSNVDIATFNVATQPTVGIDMATTNGTYYLGAIDYTNATARTINNSSATSGVLTLNGNTVNSVANTIIRNSTTANLTIANGTGALGLALGNTTNNIIQITNSGNVSIGSIISGAGNLTRQGAGSGVLTLASNNTYIGTTFVADGTIRIGQVGAFGAANNSIVVSSGGAVDVNAIDIDPRTYNITIAGSGAGGAGAITNNSGNVTGGFKSLTLSANATIGGSGRWDVRDDTTSNATVNLAGHTLTKVGANRINFVLGNMTADGVINVNQGALGLSRMNVSGNGSMNFAAGASLALENYFTGSYVISKAINFSGATLNMTNPSVTGLASFSSPIGLAGNNTFDIPTVNLIVSGSVSGNGSLVKAGNGTLTFNGTNSFTGGATLNQGTLTIGTAGTLSGSTGTLQVSNTNNVAAGTNVVLNLSTAANTTTGSLSGTIATPISGTNTATINTQSGRTFTVNQTSNGTYAGVIAGNGNFALGGSSTSVLTLTGNNTYTGTTTLNAGTLAVNGSLASTSVVINGRLGGSGVMAGATLSGSGVIAPGNSPGIMTAAAFDPSGGLDQEFEFTAASMPNWGNATASVNDVLRLTAGTPFTGNLTAANTVRLYFPTLDEGDVFTGGFFTDASAPFLDAITGATFEYYLFNGIGYDLYGGPNTITVSTVLVPSANFTGGTVTNGYSSQFVVVPEPGTLVLAGIGVAGVAAAVGRRRRKA